MEMEKNKTMQEELKETSNADPKHPKPDGSKPNSLGKPSSVFVSDRKEQLKEKVLPSAAEPTLSASFKDKKKKDATGDQTVYSDANLSKINKPMHDGGMKTVTDTEAEMGEIGGTSDKITYLKGHQRSEPPEAYVQSGTKPKTFPTRNSTISDGNQNLQEQPIPTTPAIPNKGQQNTTDNGNSNKVIKNSTTKSDGKPSKDISQTGTEADSKLSKDTPQTDTRSDAKSNKYFSQSTTKSEGKPSKATPQTGTGADSKPNKNTLQTGAKSDDKPSKDTLQTSTGADLKKSKDSSQTGSQSDYKPSKATPQTSTDADGKPNKDTLQTGAKPDEKLSRDTSQTDAGVDCKPSKYSSQAGSQSDYKPSKATAQTGTGADGKPNKDTLQTGAKSDDKPSKDTGQTETDAIPSRYISQNCTQSDSKLKGQTGTEVDGKLSRDTSQTDTDADAKPNDEISQTGAQSEVKPNYQNQERGQSKPGSTVINSNNADQGLEAEDNQKEKTAQHTDSSNDMTQDSPGAADKDVRKTHDTLGDTEQSVDMEKSSNKIKSEDETQAQVKPKPTLSETPKKMKHTGVEKTSSIDKTDQTGDDRKFVDGMEVLDENNMYYLTKPGGSWKLVCKQNVRQTHYIMPTTNPKDVYFNEDGDLVIDEKVHIIEPDKDKTKLKYIHVIDRSNNKELYLLVRKFSYYIYSKRSGKMKKLQVPKDKDTKFDGNDLKAGDDFYYIKELDDGELELSKHEETESEEDLDDTNDKEETGKVNTTGTDGAGKITEQQSTQSTEDTPVQVEDSPPVPPRSHKNILKHKQTASESNDPSTAAGGTTSDKSGIDIDVPTCVGVMVQQQMKLSKQLSAKFVGATLAITEQNDSYKLKLVCKDNNEYDEALQWLRLETNYGKEALTVKCSDVEKEIKVIDKYVTKVVELEIQNKHPDVCVFWDIKKSEQGDKIDVYFCNTRGNHVNEVVRKMVKDIRCETIDLDAFKHVAQKDIVSKLRKAASIENVFLEAMMDQNQLLIYYEKKHKQAIEDIMDKVTNDFLQLPPPKQGQMSFPGSAKQVTQCQQPTYASTVVSSSAVSSTIAPAAGATAFTSPHRPGRLQHYSAYKHKSWVSPGHHEIVIAQMNADQCQRDVLVTIAENDPEGIKFLENDTVALLIPKWIEEKKKEKERTRTVMGNLLDELRMKGQKKIVFKVTHIAFEISGLKKIKHMTAATLVHFNRSDLQDTVVVFCCETEQLYKDFVDDFDKAMPKDYTQNISPTEINDLRPEEMIHLDPKQLAIIDRYLWLILPDTSFTQDKVGQLFTSFSLAIQIVFVENNNTALLICKTPGDAKLLEQFRENSCRVRRLQPNDCVLDQFQIEPPKKYLTPECKISLEKMGIDVDLNKGTVIAPTSYQIQYAKQFLETESLPKHLIIEAGTHIQTIFYEKWAEKIQDFKQGGGKIEQSENNIKFVYRTQSQICNDCVTVFQQNISKLSELDIQVCEGTKKVEEKEIKVEMIEARKWCDEIEKEFEKHCCIFDDDREMFIIFCDEYTLCVKIKNMLLVKLGKREVKRTGRRRENAQQPQSLPQSLPERSPPANSTHFNVNDVSVYVYKANICKLAVDCIVNAANERLNHGGGVARAISDAAGYKLDDDGHAYIKKYGRISVGEVCTTTAGNLPYKTVIHAVGPQWDNYTPHDLGQVKRCADHLHYAVLNSLEEADTQGLSSIALPAISSAIFRVPIELCTTQYARAVYTFSRRSGAKLREIHFIDIKDETVESIKSGFTKAFESDKEPMCDFSVFVRPSNRSNRLKVAVDKYDAKTVSYLPQPILEQHRAGRRYEIGPFKCLYVYQDNLLSTGSEIKAVVIPINKNGSGSGQLLSEIESRISKDYKEIYQKEKSDHLKRSRLGSIFVTGGYGCGFIHIIFAVIQGGQYRIMFDKLYKDVFEECKKKKIDSVATIILTDKFTDLRQSVDVFVKELLTVANDQHKLDVHIRCSKSSSHKTVTAFNSHVQPAPDYEEIEFQGASSMTVHQGPNTGADGTDIDTGVGEDCVICMDKITEPKRLPCGHVFCKECIDQQFKHKQVCPTCFKVFGTIEGDQPPGKMEVTIYKQHSCAGYPYCGQIQINYSFRDGIQRENHPNPGTSYIGISRRAFLPENDQGRLVCKMLKVAFKRKLVFTIGHSRTTGADGVITWNDIHHKTDHRTHSQFGYPDPTYLDRVTQELAAKGVTPEDVKHYMKIEDTICSD